jgi:hypothetical protein
MANVLGLSGFNELGGELAFVEARGAEIQQLQSWEEAKRGTRSGADRRQAIRHEIFRDQDAFELGQKNYLGREVVFEAVLPWLDDKSHRISVKRGVNSQLLGELRRTGGTDAVEVAEGEAEKFGAERGIEVQSRDASVLVRYGDIFAAKLAID